RDHHATTTTLPLPPTLIYDHPPPHTLATHLTQQLTGTTSTHAALNTQTPSPTNTSTPADPDEPVAIIAMACHYPGDTHTPEQLWHHLLNTTDTTTPFPHNRGWDLQTLHHPDPEHPDT